MNSQTITRNQLAKLFDHTLLKAFATKEDFRRISRSILKQGVSDYEMKKAQTFRDNFMKALKEGGSTFKNYKLLYKDTMMNDYKFMVKKDNVEFYDLFNYIINTNSYYNYRNTGIANLHASILEDSTFEQVYTIVLAIIFIPLIAFGIIWLIIKKKNFK